MLFPPPLDTHPPTAARFHRHIPLTARLVAEAGEVVGELLDDVGGVAGHVLLAVVADDDGLRRLGDADAGPALSGEKTAVSNRVQHNGRHVTEWCPGGEGGTYQTSVQTPVLGLRGDVSLPRDVEALGEGAGLGVLGV